MANAKRQAERREAPMPCRCEIIQSAFEAGCCPEFQTEALLDRLAAPIRDGAAQTPQSRPEGTGQ